MQKEYEKMHRVLKNEQTFSCTEFKSNYFDSVESDTESLAQERAYQRQLQKRISQHDRSKSVHLQNGDVDSFQQEEEEDEDEDEAQDLQVYDSLEVAAQPQVKKSLPQLQTKYVDTKANGADNSQVLSDDVYSDLRYDPNWRTNLKGAGCFNESPHISIDENYFYLKEKSRQSHEERKEVITKEGYRLIIDTSPAVVVTPQKSDQVYCLHPQDGQTSSVTSSHPHSQALRIRPPQVDHPGPPGILNKTDRVSQKRVKVKHEISNDNIGENNNSSAESAEEHSEDIDAMYAQRTRTIQGRSTQQMNISKTSSPKDLLNRKEERLTEDFVERNKKTLGRNTSKYSSYARAHATKQEVSHDSNKVPEAPAQIISGGSEEDISNPEDKWLQKTQELKVTQIRKGKKAQRKENPNPLQQQQPPAPEVKAEQGDSLSSPLTKAAAKSQLKPQNTSSSHPLPPTIQFNINLNTSSHLLPFLQQEGEDSIISLMPFHGEPHANSGSDIQLALAPGYRHTGGKPFKMFQEGLNAKLNQWNMENFPGQWPRVPVLKGPLFCLEEDEQKMSYNEIQAQQLTESIPITPTSTLSQGSGSYKVLPPIGRPGLDQETEVSPDGSLTTNHQIQRRVSDGYLVQMEKHKHLRTRATYKAYSLKDYKQLKPDVILQGLGPDYTTMEKTKMRRQKLYSNVIREQNKKISRIPFLPAKDPETNDKKVPRMKALEYAKTISKPPQQLQSKIIQKRPNEDSTEHAPYLKGLDLSLLTTLELLRKRHEDEKQAVALL